MNQTSVSPDLVRLLEAAKAAAAANGPLTAVSPWDPPAVPRLRPIDVRRAILAVYLRRGGGPLAVAGASRLLGVEEGIDVGAARVSDVLRHQARAGRAMVLRRGVYRLHLSQFSRSTQWRCLNWRRMAAHAADPRRRYKRAPDVA